MLSWPSHCLRVAWWLVQALGLWVVACFLLDDAEALGTQRLLASTVVVAAIGGVARSEVSR